MQDRTRWAAWPMGSAGQRIGIDGGATLATRDSAIGWTRAAMDSFPGPAPPDDAFTTRLRGGCSDRYPGSGGGERDGAACTGVVRRCASRGARRVDEI